MLVSIHVYGNEVDFCSYLLWPKWHILPKAVVCWQCIDRFQHHFSLLYQWLGSTNYFQYCLWPQKYEDRCLFVSCLRSTFDACCTTRPAHKNRAAVSDSFNQFYSCSSTAGLISHTSGQTFTYFYFIFAEILHVKRHIGHRCIFLFLKIRHNFLCGKQQMRQEMLYRAFMQLHVLYQLSVAFYVAGLLHANWSLHKTTFVCITNLWHAT